MRCEYFILPQEKSACNREIRASIGQQLKAKYNYDLSQPIPDCITDLLTQLAEQRKEVRGT